MKGECRLWGVGITEIVISRRDAKAQRKRQRGLLFWFSNSYPNYLYSMNLRIFPSFGNKRKLIWLNWFSIYITPNSLIFVFSPTFSINLCKSNINIRRTTECIVKFYMLSFSKSLTPRFNFFKLGSASFKSTYFYNNSSC